MYNISVSLDVFVCLCLSLVAVSLSLSEPIWLLCLFGLLYHYNGSFFSLFGGSFFLLHRRYISVSRCSRYKIVYILQFLFLQIPYFVIVFHRNFALCLPLWLPFYMSHQTIILYSLFSLSLSFCIFAWQLADWCSCFIRSTYKYESASYCRYLYIIWILCPTFWRLNNVSQVSRSKVCTTASQRQ